MLKSNSSIVLFSLGLILSALGCATGKMQNVYTCPASGSPCYVDGMARMTDEEWAEQAKRVDQRKKEYDERGSEQRSAIRQHDRDQSSQIAARGTLFKKGFCYPTFSLKYAVNQKLDKNHYGLVMMEPTLTDPYPHMVSGHAIIEMNHYNPNQQGYLNTNVEYIETKKLPLDNGFEADTDILKECVQVYSCDENRKYSENGMHRCPGHKPNNTN